MMKTTELRSAWNKIKNRHGGPYSTWTPEEQAGALLVPLTLDGAIGRAASFIEDGDGPTTYWRQVHALLVSAKTEETSK
jgi:hypothetical protein